MTPERYQRIVDVLNKRQPDLTVITDEVHKGRNIAAIVRTCDAVGVDTIHAVMPKAGFQPYRGTALGSQKWVDVALYESPLEPIKNLQEKGFQVVAAHLSDNAVDYREIDYTKPTALLLGTEKYGVSESALEYVDIETTVPMQGMVASFNVSVACAIIMAEARHQREQAGLYGQARLSDELYQKRLFCWCYPDLAEYCHQHDLKYPLMNEQGDLVDASAWYAKVKQGIADKA
ncbi:MAG: tRNA (guanosine(18)-2'-O)-methyltransferase TrmH [Cellvibrionaceae bacterium]